VGRFLRRFAPWLLLAATLGATATVCVPPTGAPPARATATAPAPALPRLRVDFVSVGQGDAALVTGPTGKIVLIDGGPTEAGPTLTALLRARQTKGIDLVLLTHRHEDHLGGIAAVVRAFPVRLFMDAPFPHKSLVYERLLETLQDHHVMVLNAQRGRTIDVGAGAMLTLLSPPDPPITRSRSDVNANSVVVRLDYGTTGILFAADAEPQTERWLLASDARLSAQVLKVAHHGGRYSSTPRFLSAVAPTAAVISVGAVNEYGHPTPETLTRLGQQRAHVYRTDRDGTVTVESDGTRIEVTTAGGKREILVAR
jgi:beta-lactamase superfamily II metal-dependent hydrolase